MLRPTRRARRRMTRWPPTAERGNLFCSSFSVLLLLDPFPPPLATGARPPWGRASARGSPHSPHPLPLLWLPSPRLSQRAQVCVRRAKMTPRFPPHQATLWPHLHATKKATAKFFPFRNRVFFTFRKQRKNTYLSSLPLLTAAAPVPEKVGHKGGGRHQELDEAAIARRIARREQQRGRTRRGERPRRRGRRRLHRDHRRWRHHHQHLDLLLDGLGWRLRHGLIPSRPRGRGRRRR